MLILGFESSTYLKNHQRFMIWIPNQFFFAQPNCIYKHLQIQLCFFIDCRSSTWNSNSVTYPASPLNFCLDIYKNVILFKPSPFLRKTINFQNMFISISLLVCILVVEVWYYWLNYWHVTGFPYEINMKHMGLCLCINFLLFTHKHYFKILSC